MDIFFSSDFHFGHKNIVKGVSEWEPKDHCRDFNTVEEMDNLLLENINKIIKKEDILYFLGDFAFGNNKIEKCRYYRDRINCSTIHMIRGNHDSHSWKNRQKDEGIKQELSKIFTSCQDSLSIYIGNKLYILNHYCQVTWEEQNRESYHVHGHSHGNLKPIEGLKHMDIGIDTNNYQPYSTKEVNLILSKVNRVKLDHH